MDNERRLQLCDIADGLLTDVSSANVTTKTITNLKIQNLGKSLRLYFSKIRDHLEILLLTICEIKQN